MPDSIKKSSNSNDVDILARDYIAGMSDRYAIAKYNELYIPSFWAL
ncbi:MAG: hypothetical protein IJD36_03870 [Clostridia bacterium]|nr:hypothetical protein [Clostridia bacterium]